MVKSCNNIAIGYLRIGLVENYDLFFDRNSKFALRAMKPENWSFSDFATDDDYLKPVLHGSKFDDQRGQFCFHMHYDNMHEFRMMDYLVPKTDLAKEFIHELDRHLAKIVSSENLMDNGQDVYVEQFEVLTPQDDYFSSSDPAMTFEIGDEYNLIRTKHARGMLLRHIDHKTFQKVQDKIAKPLLDYYKIKDVSDTKATDAIIQYINQIPVHNGGMLLKYYDTLSHLYSWADRTVFPKIEDVLKNLEKDEKNE